MKAPIHSRKHYIQVTFSTATTISRNLEPFAISVAQQDVNAANEVNEGAIVKAVYVELWAIGSVSEQFFTVIFEKAQGGDVGASFSNMTNLDSYPNKKNVFYTTQGLASNDGIAAPIPIIRQWFKIPKSKQRMGLGDRLVLVVASRGTADIDYCGFATYKEYT